MDKIKAFLDKYKGIIATVVAFIFGGLAATGHVVPQALVDFVNSLVNAL